MMSTMKKIVTCPWISTTVISASSTSTPSTPSQPTTTTMVTNNNDDINMAAGKSLFDHPTIAHQRHLSLFNNLSLDSVAHNERDSLDSALTYSSSYNQFGVGSPIEPPVLALLELEEDSDASPVSPEPSFDQRTTCFPAFKGPFGGVPSHALQYNSQAGSGGADRFGFDNALIDSRRESSVLFSASPVSATSHFVGDHIHSSLPSNGCTQLYSDTKSFMGQRTDTEDSGIGTIVDETEERLVLPPFSSAFPEQPESNELINDEDEEAQQIKEAKSLLTRSILRCDKLNEYQLLVLLGYGTFGIVVEALSPGGVNVAIKIMRKAQVHASRLCVDPRSGKTTTLEIALLKYAPPQKNIISYVASWDDDECWYLVTGLGGHSWNKEDVDSVTGLPMPVARLVNYEMIPVVGKLALQTQFERVFFYSSRCDSPPQTILIPSRTNDSSLAGLLRSCGGYTTEAGHIVRRGRPVLVEVAQKHIIRQIASALNALHMNGICHKDLKDENVLVDADLQVHLIDFGHAAFFRSPEINTHIRPFKSYGTPLFAPPEVRSGLTFVGPEADSYALGLILYEMNYGDLPVELENCRYVPGGETPCEISFRTGFFTVEVQDLCSKLLSLDPVLRPSMEEVLAHPWLA